MIRVNPRWKVLFLYVLVSVGIVRQRPCITLACCLRRRVQLQWDQTQWFYSEWPWIQTGRTQSGLFGNNKLSFFPTHRTIYRAEISAMLTEVFERSNSRIPFQAFAFMSVFLCLFVQVETFERADVKSKVFSMSKSQMTSFNLTECNITQANSTCLLIRVILTVAGCSFKA